MADVITVFLRSLTEHWDGKIIAVIVSGYDGDGAAALCGIKEVGGITIAQKPDTATQPDMPQSAIAKRVYRFLFFHLRISLKKLYELREEIITRIKEQSWGSLKTRTVGSKH